MSQNRNAADRAGVSAGLAASERKKKIIGFTDGAPKNSQEWCELLFDLEPRSQTVARLQIGWRARVLKGGQRGLANDVEAALLGAQDGQRARQGAEEPAAEGQTLISVRSTHVPRRKCAPTSWLRQWSS